MSPWPAARTRMAFIFPSAREVDENEYLPAAPTRCYQDQYSTGMEDWSGPGFIANFSVIIRISLIFVRPEKFSLTNTLNLSRIRTKCLDLRLNCRRCGKLYRQSSHSSNAMTHGKPAGSNVRMSVYPIPARPRNRFGWKQ